MQLAVFLHFGSSKSYLSSSCGWFGEASSWCVTQLVCGSSSSSDVSGSVAGGYGSSQGDRGGLGSVLRDLVKPGDENLREMNKKLQNMLEEQLTKNMHLQKVPPSPHRHTHTHPAAALIWQINWTQSVFLCRTWSCSPRNWFVSAKTVVLLAAQPDQSEFIWSFPSFYLDYCSPKWKVRACTHNSSLAFPYTTWSCSHLPISVCLWAAGVGTLSSAPLGCFWMYKNWTALLWQPARKQTLSNDIIFGEFQAASSYLFVFFSYWKLDLSMITLTGCRNWGRDFRFQK